MNQLEKEKTEIPCPGGGKPIQTTFGELTKKNSLKSNKGHEYRFKSNDQQKLKYAMNKIEQVNKDFERSLEKAQKDFKLAYQNLLSNADVLLKR